MIVSKSYSLTDQGVKYVDVVNEVLRYVPLYWTATELVRVCLIYCCRQLTWLD